MARVSRILQTVETLHHATRHCPAHCSGSGSRLHATKTTECEYAFEMATSSVRVGPGVTAEIGMDLANIGAKNVLLFTDPNVCKLPGMKVILDAITKAGVNVSVYDKVRVEPTDISFKEAIAFAKSKPFDAFVAFGGGSTMDTAKAANLFAEFRDNDFMDFVNAPIGKGLPVTRPLKPLFAIPTTSGTGSETTGVAIFDLTDRKVKTGIASRMMRPILGLVDPLLPLSMPRNVAAYSGFDVLCHALESYTAIPFNQRKPRPANPRDRPTYQGSNPISDIWSTHALEICAKHLIDSVETNDPLARLQMHLASTFAGIGFGNAGVHLCHGLSYSISGNVKSFRSPGYESVDKPLVPHGLSVMITAPSVFSFTAPACPDRHLEAARLLGANVTNAKKDDAGKILGDCLRRIMERLKVPNGISELGYTSADIPALVEGSIHQERVIKLAPSTVGRDALAEILENSLRAY